ncbi:MAG TPA: sigma-70 family RNA polymerase sigma factor [Blastocatellia bacterium]|jgi:RNA polymerase sigma factor (TIGR02999 family)
MQPPQSITQLLVKWSEGDKSALDELMPLVYETLRKLASGHLRRERGDLSLQPTALVHEAYLRLVEQSADGWQSRAQFFGLAAKVMRNILVDYARQRIAMKRGGGQLRVSLSKADRFNRRADVDLIALSDALNELAAIKPEHARVIELRFFAGLTIEETSAVMGISHATVERDWAFARAWLRREIKN